jgi:uncharacterized paraquat-inducible protein A
MDVSATRRIEALEKRVGRLTRALSSLCLWSILHVFVTAILVILISKR